VTPVKTFFCPRCGFRDSAFHTICPACGRPFARDYVDKQMHPRDPDTTGIFSGRLWARVFLACALAGFGLYLLGMFSVL